ncbi:hypothetical protein ACE38W_01910 [Chitinophaga sp. Hz27]|uniref:hypothetical protein n=1 Tax=Chitinophaga sp. Hz27 TaxID=3347169 RepID=UPI0035E1A23F
MRKAKILLPIAFLLAVAASAAASKARLRFVFYKATSSTAVCTIPTTLTGTFVNQGIGTITASSYITTINQFTTCPPTTMFRGL